MRKLIYPGVRNFKNGGIHFDETILFRKSTFGGGSLSEL